MNTKKRVTVAFAVIVILCVFAEKISADVTDRNFQTINIYYYDLLQEKAVFVSQPIDVYGKFTNEQTAFIIYANLFEHYDMVRPPFIAEGTKLLSIKINDGHLIIDVSEQVKNYGGGTSFEHALVNTIIKNARQINGVTKLSLVINGKPEYLPEGTGIFEMEI